jgi:hypothetical protein
MSETPLPAGCQQCHDRDRTIMQQAEQLRKLHLANEQLQEQQQPRLAQRVAALEASDKESRQP